MGCRPEPFGFAQDKLRRTSSSPDVDQPCGEVEGRFPGQGQRRPSTAAAVAASRRHRSRAASAQGGGRDVALSPSASLRTSSAALHHLQT